MRGSKFLLLCVTVLAAGVTGWALERYVFKGSDPAASLRSTAPGNTDPEKNDPKILYWVAPMDPSYRRDGPGKSPRNRALSR